MVVDNLTLRIGEPFGVETLTITNPDGTPSDLTGATLTFVVRELDGGTNLLAVPFALVSPPTAGKATLTVPATGAQSVANLAGYVGKPLRYKVLDGAGGRLQAGSLFVASEWGRL